MTQIITIVLFSVSLAFIVNDVEAYIDPGTAGAVAGGVGAGIATVFAFFGSLAIAAMIKVKKLWKWNVFGKVIIGLAILILIGLAWFGISFLIG